MAGYKMVGNAVPPNMAYFLAKQIRKDLESIGISKDLNIKNHMSTLVRKNNA